MAQDYDLVLRLLDVTELSCVPEVLYHHRLSPEGIGRSRRAEQAAFADLAKGCAKARDRRLAEPPLVPRIGTGKLTAEILTDAEEEAVIQQLVKSNAKALAASRLKSWKPLTPGGRRRKTLYVWLNRFPSPLTRIFLEVSRLRELV
jgi:hypothetical protein